MKIVYLIAGTFNSGGMERVLANKTNWLVEHGYEVSIVTTDQRDQKPYFPLHPSIQCFDLDINYDANNGKPFWNKLLSYPIKQYRHRRRLSRLLKRLQADITVCMFNNDVSFVSEIQDGSKKILEVHFSKLKKLQYGRHGLWRWVDVWRTLQEEKYVRRYDKFVVLTHEDKQLWGNLPNITVIPNACTFKTTEKADLSQKCVLAVGRLEEQKGFDRLLDIWSLLATNMPGWKLVIVGSGPLHDNLQKQVDSLGISDSVILQGSVKNMNDIYLQASILAMTSHYEGLPMALLEAQAFGIPMVAYACKCGPRDIITDGKNGFLIEEGNQPDFVQKLSLLMQDEGLRKQMGREAQVASKDFSEERIMSQWNLLFQSFRKDENHSSFGS